jgi:hypothetical protein
VNIKHEWLNLTEQQFNLFTIVYELNIKKKASKVKNIIFEYRNKFHTEIKRQNLFNQLKILIDKNLIRRNSEFSYFIVKDGIKSRLAENKDKKEKELDEFNNLLNGWESTFDSVLSIPKVSYLDPANYTETMSTLINQSSVLLADSPFPNICYEYSFYKNLDRKEFIESMKLNCFKLKTLKICYLTNLVIDLTFRRCLRLFKSPLIAYRRCQHSIDRLEKQVRIFPNLDIRYVEVLPGPHMYVFKNGEYRDVILSLRGSNVQLGLKDIEGTGDPYGGIHVSSQQIAEEASKIFMNTFEKAIPLKRKKGAELFKKTRENLDKLYELSLKN